MSVQDFLSNYNTHISEIAQHLRRQVLSALPQVQEHVDAPAKMIMYSYGPKYADLVCNIIPSQKGLKLGFNRGVELPDPNKLLQGKGKISRYIDIRTTEQIDSAELNEMLQQAMVAYRETVGLK